MLNSPVQFAIKFLTSPFIIFIIIWLLTDSRREGFLVALLVYTTTGLGFLIMKLLATANPALIIPFLFASIRGLFLLMSLAIFWVIYLVAYGSNFDLTQTFAIFS